ncbi:MAG: argininosuccinate lyase [Spirochaetes bacterium]|nr:argininosuccinate lyase [Spirochaetota bacterium]
MGKAWSGRFEKGTARAMEDFHSSLHFDRRLFREDIAGSRAHAEMLCRRGILTAKDLEAILGGLQQVESELEAGTLPLESSLEDIHMAVEKRLTDLVGEAGGRLHTARSRNDQVATDVRLWLRHRIDEQTKGLHRLLSVLVAEAEKHAGLILPGTTHLQPAQPILLGFWFMAWFGMFRRDLERLQDCRKRVNVSPLGGGAFAGVNYAVDRAFTASRLGFDGSSANAMDGVSDRDFAAEYIAAAAIFMAHLSRLCEELILWCNPAFGYVEMDDAWSTGSSIMPNKKNPDACELLRGKTARVIGDLAAILSLQKGLPLAYNKDLQEDKDALFDASDTVEGALIVLPELLSTLAWKEAPMRAACEKGYLQATDVADYLVGKGMPFREAHHVSGAIVRHLAQKNLRYGDLSPGDFRKFSPHFQDDILEVVDLERVLRNKKSPGSTHPDEVASQIAQAKAYLSAT